MSRLYLVCAICDRRQADGLISGAAWGRMEFLTGTTIEHPAVRGTTVLACPSCVTSVPGWEQRALDAVGAKRIDAA